MVNRTNQVVKMPTFGGSGNGNILPIKISAQGSQSCILWNLDTNTGSTMEVIWSLQLQHVVPEVTILCSAILRKFGRDKKDYRDILTFVPGSIIIPSSLSITEPAASKCSARLVMLDEPILGVYYGHFEASYVRANEFHRFEIIHKLQFIKPSLTKK